MNYVLNGEQRNLRAYNKETNKGGLKYIKPRKIQIEGIQRIKSTIANCGKILVNMPCRSGKTFTTLYSCYQEGVELVIVLCGKRSAKASYLSDSVWLNPETNQVEGFPIVATEKFYVNQVLKDTDYIKRLVGIKSSVLDLRIVLEITPQLLNKNPELVLRLRDLANSKKTAFVFDEAHFAEQTQKSQNIISNMVGENSDDEVNYDQITETFESNIPYIYLTASPDTESLQNNFLKNGAEEYELTKEQEWDLYLEDLKKPVEEREFTYVPVRNCLYISNDLLDLIFNAKKSKIQDFVGLFTLPVAVEPAKKFVMKSLVESVKAIVEGPSYEYLQGEDSLVSNQYVRRGSNVNLMIKLPKKAKHQEANIGQKVTDLINSVKQEILAAFNGLFNDIHILDVTGNNNCSQDEANEHFDKVEHSNSINIILTKKRLIEGTTLDNLDGFVFWANENSLCALKQQIGRTLTPSAGKRFGFIFFFDETSLSTVRMLLQKKAGKLPKGQGLKKLSEDDKKRITRILPTFISKNDEPFKLLDCEDLIYEKTLLERARQKEGLFDKDILFAIPGLKDLLAKAGLLGTLKVSVPTTKGSNSSQRNNSGKSLGNKTCSGKVTENTPNEEIKLEALVTKIMYIHQDCILNDFDVNEINRDLELVCLTHDFPINALRLMYSNNEIKDVIEHVYTVVQKNMQKQNPEIFA